MRRILLSLVVALGGALVVPLTAISPPAAFAADPEPARATLLPAPQINGVVWKQAVAGNTVFAGGEFTTARQIASQGGGSTSVTNLIAYNLTTGALDTSFTPTFNGVINDLTVTPDGTKLVVVGTFTQVNGSNRNRVAVFDLPGRTLNPSVAPNVNANTMAVDATNSTIFLGGNFSLINGISRAKTGAVSMADGSTTAFDVPIDNRSVRSVVVSPDGSQVVLAGNFTSVGGSDNPGYGLYRANASTGAMLPLPVNAEVRNAGDDAFSDGLSSDGTNFFGTGWHFGGGGNSEGVFQASWADGSLVTLEDCHGDTYDAAPIGSIVYAAGHKHQCLNSDGFPQTEPDWTHWHSTAWTKAASGVNNVDTYGRAARDHPGTPKPKLLPFFPRYGIGSFTGQSQATWTVTGTSDYVLYGGEFVTVNGTAQQGIARFGVRGVGLNTSRPITQDFGSSFTPSVRSLGAGQVAVSWLNLWDRDDLTLTYEVLRNGTVVHTTNVDGFQWSGKPLRFVDTGLGAGSTPSYVVRVSDPWGNVLNSSAASTTVASANQLDTYSRFVVADGATKFWRLNDAGSGVADLVGADNTIAGSGVGRGAAGAMTNSADQASTFDGTSNGTIISSQQTMAPNTFSIEAWFKASPGAGGKIAGFGDASTGDSGHYDRHLYMTTDGRVRFGVAPDGSAKVVSTPEGGPALNDGQWHQAVATLGSGGMKLYIDGALAGQWADWTRGENLGGLWRVGGDNTWSGPKYFTGSIDDFSVYPTALTPAQVLNHYNASGRGAVVEPGAPAVSFTSTARGRRVAFRGSTSSPTGTITGRSWNFGDGTTSSALSPTKLFARAGTFTVKLTATDNFGNSTTSTRAVRVVHARPVGTIVAGIKKKKRVNFYGTRMVDPDGRVVSYYWNFGDGTAARGAVVTHKFKKAKRYTVRLTVTDDSGLRTTVVRRVKAKR